MIRSLLAPPAARPLSLTLRCALAFTAVLLALDAHAQPASGFGSKRDASPSAPMVNVKLITSTPALIPGTTSEIGLLFTIREGWHTYAPSQNDTGTPARADWTLSGVEHSDRITVGELQWPAGKRYTQPGEILDHVYEHSVLAVAAISVPDEVPVGGVLTIRGDLEWLVCDADRCVPEFGEVAIELPIASAARGPGSPEWAAAYTNWERERGRVLTDGPRDDVTVRWDGTALMVSTQHQARLSFMPISGGVSARNLFETGTAESASLRIEFEESTARSRVLAWIRLEPLSPEAKAKPAWTSDVWLIDTRFGQPPPRILGEPSIPPTPRGG